MNKSLSLIALLFLAGQTLLTYGAQDDHERERELTRLREIRNRERDRELSPEKIFGLGLARHLGAFMQDSLEGARHRARERDQVGERNIGKDLGLGLADHVQQALQAVQQDAQSRPATYKGTLDDLRAISQNPALAQQPSSEIGQYLKKILTFNHKFQQAGQGELVRNPELANEIANTWEHLKVTSLNIANAYELACERESDLAEESRELALVRKQSRNANDRDANS